MGWMARAVTELLDLTTWWSAACAVIAALGICGLVLDGGLLAIFPASKVFFACPLVGACGWWMTAPRVRLHEQDLEWSPNTVQMERRAVVAAGMLFALTSILVGLLITAAAGPDPASVAAAIAIALGMDFVVGIFCWFRAGVEW